MANEVILFKDTVTLGVAWLTGKVGTGVEVGSAVPDPRPDLFVKVTATGAHRLDVAYVEGQLTFECWAPANNETAAADLAWLAYGHMKAAEGETVEDSFIRRVVDVGLPVDFPDPESKSPRAQFTVGVQYRGTAIA